MKRGVESARSLGGARAVLIPTAKVAVFNSVAVLGTARSLVMQRGSACVE